MFSRFLFIWPVHNVILLLSLLFLPFLCYSTVATWPLFCHDSTLLCPVFNSIKLIQPINVSIFFRRFSFSLLCCFPVALSRPFVAPSFLSLWKFVYFGLTMHACNDDWPCTPINTFRFLAIHLVQWYNHELVAFPFTSFSFSWVLSFVTVVNCGKLLHASCDWFCYQSFHMAAAIAGRRRGERCPTKNFLDCLSILLHEV